MQLVSFAKIMALLEVSSQTRVYLCKIKLAVVLLLFFHFLKQCAGLCACRVEGRYICNGSYLQK